MIDKLTNHQNSCYFSYNFPGLLISFPMNTCQYGFLPILPTSLPSCFPTKASLSVTGSLAMMIGWLCESAVAIARPWWRAFVKTSKFNFCSTKFYWHMDYSPGPKGKIGQNSKEVQSLKPEWPCPPKLVCMHFTLTSTCMIFWVDSIFWLSWSKGKIWLFLKTKKGAKSSKPEKPCPPKLVCMNFMSTSFCMNLFSQFYFLTPMD